MPTPVLDVRPKSAKNAGLVSHQIPPAASEMVPRTPQLKLNKQGWMRVRRSQLPKAGGILLPILVMLMVLAVAFGAVKLPWTTPVAEKGDPPARATLAVELVAGNPNSLLVPEEVRKSLGIRKGNVDQIAVAEQPTRTRPLVMPGSTALDPARLIRVRVRFAPAEVVEIGKIDDPHSFAGKRSAPAPRLAGRRPGEEGRPAGGALQRRRGQQEERPLRRPLAVAAR